MELISTHSHLLSEPHELEALAEAGLFRQIWLLELPHAMTINAEYPHPSTEAEILAAAKLCPGFYLPFKWVDFRLGPDQIDRAVEQGFIGFKGFCPKLPYDDDSYLPIYERIASYRTCMVFHTGHAALPTYDQRIAELGYSVLNMSPSTLYKIARFFPDLTLVAAHFGIPWENELLSNCITCCPNLYIDISGGHFDFLKNFLRAACSIPAVRPDGSFGLLADRILFGADIYVGHHQLHRDMNDYCEYVLEYFEGIRKENLSWADRIPGILAENAKKLLSHNELYHNQ